MSLTTVKASASVGWTNSVHIDKNETKELFILMTIKVRYEIAVAKTMVISKN